MASSGSDFPVTASAGTLRDDHAARWTVPHHWTDAGVAVDGQGNGAAVLHLSVALCVLNDVFREAEAMGVPVSGVRVSARGAFDTESWVSRGIVYAVDVDSSASPEEVAKVLDLVDEVAEVPRALRAGVDVERAHE